MTKRSFCALLVAASTWAGAPPGYDPNPQQLANPGFEEGEDGWNFWGARLVPEARIGRQAALISNSSPQWSGLDQVLRLNGAASVKVSGWLKARDVVPGSQPWEMARIAVEFQDESGQLVGGYPPTTMQISGTTEWVEGSREYPVPKGASRIKIQCALGNATGQLLCDDLGAVLRDASGHALQAGKIAGPWDFGKWFDVPAATNGSHFVDWSGLLDAPAGKHGWVKAKGESLVFEDGTPVRFWGTALVGTQCFPDRPTADSLAKRLSRMGANLVRLHHMDAPWSVPNLFGNRSNTLALDSAALDRVDYLIWALKRRGIYVMPDLLVHREFTKADGAPDRTPMGAKQVGIFSPNLIKLQRDFAKALFSHRNPHTGLAWKDDPALAFTECINESTIFAHFDGDQINSVYRRQLDSLARASGFVGELSRFEMDWTNPRGILKARSGSDHAGTMRFLAGLERAYYDSIRTTLSGIGAKILVGGTNYPPPILATLRDQLGTDLVISNDYWDHPQIWKIGNDWNRVDWSPLDNRSQLKSPSGNLVATKSWFPLRGKPFLVTEWNHCLPNEFEVEGVPLMAAYGAFQGWNGILQFDFEATGLGQLREGRYSLARSSSMLALWVAGAPMYLRADVAEAPETVVEGVDSAKVMTLPSYSPFLQERWALPYATRVRKSFSEPTSPGLERWDRPSLRDSGRIVSSTGQLALDAGQGTLEVRAPRAQGVSGAVAGRDFSFDRFGFRLENPVASVFAVSADTSPLARTSRAYLVAAGPSRMTGQKLSKSRTSVREIGQLPVQSQILQGRIRVVPGPGRSAVVRPISPDGTLQEPLPLERRGDAETFDPSLRPALVYEVLFQEKKP